MAAADTLFSTSVAEFYDTHLVPLIFEGYADGLARRVAAQEPNVVVETAAGTGVVTRALAPRLPPGVTYVVTDLNRPMLNRARARQPADDRLVWAQVNALALPLATESVDVVVCQFGAMFFPDRVAGFAEARRVLRPGGALLFSVWDRIETNAFAAVVTDVAAAVFPDDPPRFLARTPHGYGDVAAIRHDVRAAGFDAVTIETLELVSTAPTPRHAAVAYCEGTPLRGEIEARDPAALGVITARAEEAIAARFGTGSVEGRITGHVITAIR